MTINIPRKLQIDIEHTLFLFVLFGMVFPLSLNLSLIAINTWHIPFIVLLIFKLVKAINRPSFVKEFDSWDISILALAVLLVFSTIINDYSAENFPILFSLLMALIFTIFVRKNWNGLINIKTILIFFFCVIFVESLTGIIQQITNTSFGSPGRMLGTETRDSLMSVGESSVSRVIGTVGHPNWVATWLLVAIPFVYVSTNFIKNRIYWFISRIVLLIGIATMTLTISRAAIGLFFVLCALTAALYYLSKYYFRKFPSMRSVLLYGFVSCFLIWGIFAFWDIVMLAYSAIEYRFNQAEGSSSGASLDYRLEMYRGAYLGFQENPIFGIGYGSMRFLWESFDIYVIDGEMRPHNVYLSVLVGGGIVAATLFVFIIFYPLVRLIKHFNKTYFHFALLWGLLAYASIFVVYISPLNSQNLPFVFLIFGMAMGQLDFDTEKDK